MGSNWGSTSEEVPPDHLPRLATEHPHVPLSSRAPGGRVHHDISGDLPANLTAMDEGGTMGGTRRTIRGLAAAAVVALATAMPALATTSVKPYAVPIGTEYDVTPLFSVDDTVPLLGGTEGQQYRMVGIPDGLGAHPNGDGTSTLYMNHELNFNSMSEPVVGGVENRGAIVSKWILDADGNPIAGRRAYDTVYDENTFVGPAAQTDNSTRAFARFCSGFLAGPAKDRKSTRLNSSHVAISYAVFCLKKKKNKAKLNLAYDIKKKKHHD